MNLTPRNCETRSDRLVELAQQLSGTSWQRATMAVDAARQVLGSEREDNLAIVAEALVLLRADQHHPLRHPVPA